MGYDSRSFEVITQGLGILDYPVQGPYGVCLECVGILQECIKIMFELMPYETNIPPSQGQRHQDDYLSQTSRRSSQ